MSEKISEKKNRGMCLPDDMFQIGNMMPFVPPTSAKWNLKHAFPSLREGIAKSFREKHYRILKQSNLMDASSSK